MDKRPDPSPHLLPTPILSRYERVFVATGLYNINALNTFIEFLSVTVLFIGTFSAATIFLDPSGFVCDGFLDSTANVAAVYSEDDLCHHENRHIERRCIALFRGVAIDIPFLVPADVTRCNSILKSHPPRGTRLSSHRGPRPIQEWFTRNASLVFRSIPPLPLYHDGAGKQDN